MSAQLSGPAAVWLEVGRHNTYYYGARGIPTEKPLLAETEALANKLARYDHLLGTTLIDNTVYKITPEVPYKADSGNVGTAFFLYEPPARGQTIDPIYGVISQRDEMSQRIIVAPKIGGAWDTDGAQDYRDKMTMQAILSSLDRVLSAKDQTRIDRNKVIRNAVIQFGAALMLTVGIGIYLEQEAGNRPTSETTQLEQIKVLDKGKPEPPTPTLGITPTIVPVLPSKLFDNIPPHKVGE